MSLYKFEKALPWLESRGYPEVEDRNITIFNEEINLRKSLQKGEIRFGSDGVYLKRNGREYRGYIYQPDYNVERYGSLSRFHLRKCEVISSFIDTQRIGRYSWSNAPTNDIQERSNRDQVYPNSTLQYCSKCRAVYSTPVTTTEDFHALLKANKQDISATDILRSVPPNWKDITGRD